MVLNVYYFCYLNYCNSSTMISRTLSPISSTSPSIRVIGSNDGLVAFDFFHDPSFVCSLYLLTWKGVLSCSSWSSSPCSDFSSSSVWGEGDLPLHLESHFFIQPTASWHASLPLGSSPWHIFLLLSQLLDLWLGRFLFLLLRELASTYIQFRWRVPLYRTTLDDLLNSVICSEIR